MSSQIDFPKRSTFVSTVAWVFIVLSGMFTLISVAQNIMVHVMMSGDHMREALAASQQAGQMPPIARFMFGHFGLFFGLMLALGATMLVASIGLLLRKNWARRLFIVMLGVGITWNLGGIVFQLLWFNSMFSAPTQAPPQFQSDFHTMAIVVSVVTAVFTLAIAGLFAWIIKRLRSSEIKREFVRVA